MKPQTTKKNKAKKCDICEKLIKGYKRRFINLFYDILIKSGNYHWEKDFDNTKDFSSGELFGERVWLWHEDVKSFISNLLSQQKARLVEKIEELKYQPPYPNYSNGYSEEVSDDEKIYNSALDKVIQLLQQDKE